MTGVDPARAVASFDSASAMHAATVAALNGRSFPHLGQGGLSGAAARLGGRLPWPILRRAYTRIGASEGLSEQQVGQVDLAAVAGWLAGAYPALRYPGVMIGSSNGALTHLAAAAQIPWLPGTVLVPVRRSGDVDDLDAAMRFGRRIGPRLLDANPDVVLHHMHDQLQDELMAAEMAYFRCKWSGLPAGYRQFLAERLLPGAPVLLISDTSTWPVVRVSERHVFQPGAQGGVDPQTYVGRPRTPTPDDTAPEAEWGAEPGLARALTRWCHDQGHPLVRIEYQGPQAPSHPVATTFRTWYRERAEDHRRLIIPSFVLADPWLTITRAAVPYWTFFSVQPALDALTDHLAAVEPYREAFLMPFQHGADSPGIATPDDWAAVLHRHGVIPHFLRHRPDQFPHDIGFLGRYGPALAALSPARRPWTPLPIDQLLHGLAAAGLPAT